VTTSTDEELRRLHDERDLLLQSLRDLDREEAAGDLSPDDADDLRTTYTARAAEVLRAIDTHGRPVEPTKPETATDDDPDSPAAADLVVELATVSPRRSPSRRLVWALAVVAFVALAGAFLLQASGSRGAGDTSSGDIRQTTRDLLLEARQAWTQGDIDAGLVAYDEVLAIAPTNAEALTYSAWVGRNNDRFTDEEALVRLDDAVASDPAFGEARIFRAIVLSDLGRTADAATDLLAVDPAEIPTFMGETVGGFAMELAAASVVNGDVGQAAALLDLAVVAQPTNVDALLAKGELLGTAAMSLTGEDRTLLEARSRQSLDEAVALAPTEPVPLLVRATVLFNLGDIAGATVDLDALDALSPDEAVAAESAALRARLG